MIKLREVFKKLIVEQETPFSPTEKENLLSILNNNIEDEKTHSKQHPGSFASAMDKTKHKAGVMGKGYLDSIRGLENLKKKVLEPGMSMQKFVSDPLFDGEAGFDIFGDAAADRNANPQNRATAINVMKVYDALHQEAGKI